MANFVIAMVLPVSERDVAALIDGARTEVQRGGDAPVPCLVELHRRGTREIFERAVAMCDGADRQVGVEILRELGGAPPRFAAEATREVVDAVIGLAAHEDARVRFHVAAALPALADAREPEEDVVRALIALAQDGDADVRYHALAGLIDDLMVGQREDVSAALEARLTDSDAQIARAARRVRDGGMWGE